jgi:hypothetical protein
MTTSHIHLKDYADPILHPNSHSLMVDARDCIISASIATVIAEILILPTNIMKERQLEYIANQTSTTAQQTMRQMVQNVVKEQGLNGIFSSYYSTIFSQIACKSLVMFSYGPIRDQLSKWDTHYIKSPKIEPTMKQQLQDKIQEKIPDKIQDKIPDKIQEKISSSPRPIETPKSIIPCLLSGGISGMIGYAITNPYEALKSPTKRVVGQQMKNTNLTGGYLLKPNLMFAFLIYGTEFGGYDCVKNYYMNRSISNYYWYVQVLAASTVGIISSFISIPADIMRTYSMKEMKGSEGAISHAIRKISANGSSFRKYLLLSMARKAIWLSGFFVTYEHAKIYLNTNYPKHETSH